MMSQLPSLRSFCLRSLRTILNQRSSSEVATATKPIKFKHKWKKRRFLHSPSYCNSKAQVKNCTVNNQFRQVAISVTPLHNLPYEEQLEYKNTHIKEILRKIINRFVLTEKFPLSERVIENLKNYHLMCSLDPCLPSPVISGYRCKDEVVVGKGVDNNPKTVGLTVGKGFKSYTIPHTYLANVGQKHKEIARAFQDFINTSAIESFSCHQVDGGEEGLYRSSGHWRIMSIRSSTLGQSMANIIFHPQSQSQDIQTRAKEELLNYFLHGPGRLCGLDTLFLQPTFKTRTNACLVPFQLIYGEPYITERLLDCKFQISIDSFFQINISAAQVLYSVIKDCAQLKPTDVILDICCGTGSIGISMAAGAKRLFGVEIIQQAVDDAILNAKLNNVSNAEFICSRASEALKKMSVGDYFDVNETVVAVVNPGRCGVNKSVIRSIRRCQQIHRLIYVTCRPVGNTINNFIDLCCPPTEKLPGVPFSPTRAVPVDMFPHTVHCELVMVFER